MADLFGTGVSGGNNTALNQIGGGLAEGIATFLNAEETTRRQNIMAQQQYQMQQVAAVQAQNRQMQLEEWKMKATKPGRSVLFTDENGNPVMQDDPRNPGNMIPKEVKLEEPGIYGRTDVTVFKTGKSKTSAAKAPTAAQIQQLDVSAGNILGGIKTAKDMEGLTKGKLSRGASAMIKATAQKAGYAGGGPQGAAVTSEILGTEADHAWQAKKEELNTKLVGALNSASSRGMRTIFEQSKALVPESYEGEPEQIRKLRSTQSNFENAAAAIPAETLIKAAKSQGFYTDGVKDSKGKILYKPNEIIYEKLPGGKIRIIYDLRKSKDAKLESFATQDSNLKEPSTSSYDSGDQGDEK